MTTKKLGSRKAAKTADGEARGAPPQEKAARPAATKTPRAPRRKKAAGPVAVHIDFPRAGEVVRPGGYTLRIGTVPPSAAVEVSIDGGEWAPCREAAGYWWFDWGGYEPGAHRVAARARLASGEGAESAARRLRVGVEAEDGAEPGVADGI